MTTAVLLITPAEQTFHERRLREHGADPVTAMCPVCRRQLCPTYREARGVLAAAGVIDWDPIREMHDQQERRQRLWQESLRDSG